jgi:hypothetical protein
MDTRRLLRDPPFTVDVSAGQPVLKFTTWRDADQIEFEQKHGLRDRLWWSVCEHDVANANQGDLVNVTASCGSMFIGHIDEIDEHTGRLYVVLD